MPQAAKRDHLDAFSTAVFAAGLAFLVAAEIWLVVNLPKGRPWGGPDEPMHLSIAEYIAQHLAWPRWDLPELIRYQNGVSYATFSSFNYWIEGLLLRYVGVPRLSSLLLFCVYVGVVCVAFWKSRLTGLVGLAIVLPQVLFVFSYVNAEPWTAVVATLLGFAIARFRAAPRVTGNIVFLFVAAAACISARSHLWVLGFVAFLYALFPRRGAAFHEDRRKFMLALIPAIAVALWWPLTSYVTHDGDLTGWAATRWSQERFGDPSSTGARTWDEFPWRLFLETTSTSFYGFWGWLSIPLPQIGVYLAAFLLGVPLIIALWRIQRRFLPLYLILFTLNVVLMFVYSVSYDFQSQGRQLFASWFLMAGVMLADLPARRPLETLSPRKRWGLALWLTAFIGLNLYATTTLALETRRLSSDPAEAAFIRLRYNDLGRARAGFEEALRINPQNARAHEGMARVLKLLNLPAEAIREYQTAVELAPNNTAARSGLGELLLQQSRFAEAVREFEAVARLQPHSADARYRLALAHAYNRNRGAALEACAEALRIDPAHENARKLRADLQREPHRRP